MEHVDVIIVGAGLSGIGGACHLKRECPQKSFVILEGRETMGGTWDLFRYPGVRSDSDMYTLGYRFRPWREAKAMADGPVDPQLHPRHGRRVRRRQNDSLQPSRAARIMVVGQRALDSRSRDWTRQNSGPTHLQLPLSLHRLLRLRERLHA